MDKPCPHCKTQNLTDAVFCANCGQSIPATKNTDSTWTIVAIVLGIVAVVVLCGTIGGLSILKDQSDQRIARMNSNSKASDTNAANTTLSLPPTPIPTPTPKPIPTTVTLEDSARYLVGKDQDLNRPADKDDIHVKRVSYLLNELALLTKEDMNSIAGATDATADYLLKDYGRKILRERLLEDMKAFYWDKSLKVRLKYKEAITAQATIEYAN